MEPTAHTCNFERNCCTQDLVVSVVRSGSTKKEDKFRYYFRLFAARFLTDDLGTLLSILDDPPEKIFPQIIFFSFVVLSQD